MNKYKTLAGNTALISIGTFGSKLLVFLMVRFYTSYLTPSDYGTADLITQTANLLFPLISLGITDGVFRFALDHPKSRRSIFTAGTVTIACGSLLFLIVVPLLHLVKEFSGYLWLIVLYTLTESYHTLCAQFIRAIGKTALYAGQGVLNTMLVIGLNILLLVVFHLGLTGYVLSVALADLLCTAYLFIREKLWRQLTPHPRASAFRQMLRYSIPLIPTTVLWWITAVSDRYMVNGFIGSEANGIYAVSYKVPTIITIVSGIFMSAWQFSAISEAQGDRQEHIRFFERVWRIFQAGMMLICSLMIAFARLEIRVLADASYFEAWKYVPVLAAAMLFASFATFLGSVYMVTRRSDLSLTTALLGASLNVGLNLLMIPSFLGIQGAAIATLACYVVVFVVRAVSVRRFIPFRLHVGRLSVSAALIAVQVITMVLSVPVWQYVQASCFCLLALLHSGPLYGMLDRGLQSLRDLLRRRRPAE